MILPKESLLGSRWWYLLPAFGILAYLFTAARLTDIAPKYDDLNDVFGFFRQLALAQSLPETIGAFFYPNNEHVTLFNHMVYFIQYRLAGEVLFYPLTLVGHLIIVLTGCLLGLVINNTRQPFYFAVISLGYINLHYWDSSFKAMTALSNQAVILFTVASLFALLRWRHLGLAVLMAFLATFSQGNGVLVWPIGLLVLLLDAHWKPARLQHATVWLATTVACIWLFAWAHQTYGLPSPTPVTADAIMQRLLQHPWLPGLSAVAFLGSTLLNAGQATLSIAVGASALLVHATQRPWRSPGHPLVLVIALFLLASAVTAGTSRGLAAGDITGVLESRYRMYSCAFVLLALVLLCERTSTAVLPQRALTLLALGLSLALNISGYRHIPAIEQQAAAFRTSYEHWLVDGDLRRQAVYFPPMSDHFLFIAEYLGLFNFMQLSGNAPILEALPAVSGLKCPPTPAPADHCPMTVRHRGNAITVAIEAAVDSRVDPLPALPAIVTLCDAQASQVMAFALPDHPASTRRWLIPEADIPAGNYRVLFQSAQQTVCETQLTKKPRKVETEMRTLFGDR